MNVDFLTFGLENFLDQSVKLDNNDDDDTRPPVQMDYGIILASKE